MSVTVCNRVFFRPGLCWLDAWLKSGCWWPPSAIYAPATPPAAASALFRAAHWCAKFLWRIRDFSFSVAFFTALFIWTVFFSPFNLILFFLFFLFLMLQCVHFKAFCPWLKCWEYWELFNEMRFSWNSRKINWNQIKDHEFSNLKLTHFTFINFFNCITCRWLLSALK